MIDLIAESLQALRLDLPMVILLLGDFVPTRLDSG